MGNHSFFEGTEKKVELMVDQSQPSLREMGDEYWKRIARSARAAVLSKISNEHCDAYLLSESSLFAFNYKIVYTTITYPGGLWSFTLAQKGNPAPWAISTAGRWRARDWTSTITAPPRTRPHSCCRRSRSAGSNGC